MNFEVRPSHAQEIYQDHLTPLEYAFQNARMKGEIVAQKHPDSLIISADTIVVLKNQILEKPEDEKHARELIKKLSGRTHQVITAFGFVLKKKEKALYDAELTNVTFRTLTPQEINAYVNSGESLDKAGGYGAQGTGSLLISRVDGCFFNVVGLPLAKFFVTLDKFLLKL